MSQVSQADLLEQIRQMYGHKAAVAAGIRGARERVKTLEFEVIGPSNIGRLSGFDVKVGLETELGKIEKVFVVLEGRGQRVGRVFIPMGFGANAPYRVVHGQNNELFAVGPEETWVKYQGSGAERKPVINERGFVETDSRSTFIWDDMEGDRLLRDVAVQAIMTVITASHQAEAAAPAEGDESTSDDGIPY